MFKILDKLKTPPHLVAKQNLFIYSLLYNKEIEPGHDYTDKFFTILSTKFQEFERSNKDLLLLEASPRTGKTDFVVNIFLTWLLGNKSRQRFLLVASNTILKKTLRGKLERVLKSPLFERMYPDVKIERNNEGEITLSNENSINFTTTSSTVPIGAGYHWIFLIDFLSGETMRSEALRSEAFAKLGGLLSRTQHNPSTKIVVDNQRLGVHDLSAYLVAQYEQEELEFERLTFPFQFTEDYSYMLRGKEILFKKNDFLVSRFNNHEKKKILARMGEFIYETQYLQKPRHARGDLVTREMFRYYSADDLKNKNFVKGFITTDLALESGRRNDFNVFQFWLVDDDEKLYLIDMMHLKIKGLQAEKALYNFYLKWKDGLGNGGSGCNFITFEDTTNSKITIQRYENGILINGKNIPLAGLVTKLKRVKNKFSRFMDSLPYIEMGNVHLPGHDVKINGIENVQDEIVEPFLREYENFREDDSHEHDDIVDCGTDAIQQAWTLEEDLSVIF